MTDELKLCPFCGSSNTTLDYYEISCPQEIRALVFCGDCGSYTTSIDRWDIRPIEDALRAQLATRDALIERLVEAGEGLTDFILIDTHSDEEKWSKWIEVRNEYRAMKGGDE